jgi:hypothetical protein
MSIVNAQPFRVPLVDPRTGIITPPWTRYFLQVFERIGGTSGSTITDLDNYLQFDIREAESSELAKRVRDIEADEHVDIAATVAELTKRVADLETEIASLVSLQAQLAQLASLINDQSKLEHFTS